MCKLSETTIHWCWRYSSRRTKFSNILSIWANKNGDKLAILNLILTTLHRIHGRIVINACVKYRKKIFIGVGRYPSGRTNLGRTGGRKDGAQIIIPPQILGDNYIRQLIGSLQAGYHKFLLVEFNNLC